MSSEVVISSGESIRLIDIPTMEKDNDKINVNKLRTITTISASYRSIYNKQFELAKTLF